MRISFSTSALVAAGLLALGACASKPATPPQELKTGEPQYLNRECKLLGTVEGRSLFSGLSEESKVQSALASAREKAAALGATHILVLKAETTGAMGVGEASVRAYRCDPGKG